VSIGDPRTASRAIVDFPWEVLDYLGWLRQQPTRRDTTGSYLFDDPKLRFDVDDADVLITDTELGVRVAGDRLRLASKRAPTGVLLEGVRASDRDTVLQLLSLFDGQRCFAEARALAKADRSTVDRVLAQAFGSYVFAPLAVSSNERAISGIEITRFPGSPYEIARPYWKNMAAVRVRLGHLDAALHHDEPFLAQLRELHVIALMGADLQTYYQPASPISSSRAAPGRLMHTVTEVVDTSQGCLILKGPRVNASFVGGARYHELLYLSLDEPEAASPRRFLGPDGLEWGRIVHGKATSEPAEQDWFCPPRPIQSAHVRVLREQLVAALAASRRADRAACLGALAEFHQSFIRLHPFHCGNQSLAMNIVNRVLVELLGAGIPHLMLDHLALRLSAPAYATVFSRCVDTYVDPEPSAAARYLRLASNRTRAFACTRRLSEATSLQQARAALQDDPTAARLLMVVG
jgi:hypothetical protein